MDVTYQRCFCDASENACKARYPRRIVSGVSAVGIVLAKSRVVLRNQKSWGIPRKELLRLFKGAKSGV